MWAKKTVLALKINHELIKGWGCGLYAMYIYSLTFTYVDYGYILNYKSPVRCLVFFIFAILRLVMAIFIKGEF